MTILPRAYSQVFATLSVALSSLATAGYATAQTLPPGIINAPPTSIGDNESIGSNTTLNVFDGGSVGHTFNAGLHGEVNSNVVVNLMGGAIEWGLNAIEGSEINISGGTARQVSTSYGALVNVNGGRVRQLDAYEGSAVVGGGVVDVLGVWSGGSDITIAGGTVGELIAPIGSSPLGGADITMTGGTLGADSYISGGFTRMTVVDGEIGSRFRFGTDTSTTVSGGLIGPDAYVAPNGYIRMHGGSVGTGLTVDGYFDVISGSVEPGMTVYGGLRAYGGEFGGAITLMPRSNVYIEGYEFSVNGSPLDVGTHTIAERSGTLSGVLRDGSQFSLSLSDSDPLSPDGYVAADARVRVSRVLAGDFNFDGSVDAGDYETWKSRYGDTVSVFTWGDGNGDGVVDAADYTVWRDNFLGEPLSVPEPAGLILGAPALLQFARRRWCWRSPG